jgi:hypothetical protein
MYINKKAFLNAPTKIKQTTQSHQNQSKPTKTISCKKNKQSKITKQHKDTLKIKIKTKEQRQQTHLEQTPLKKQTKT